MKSSELWIERIINNGIKEEKMEKRIVGIMMSDAGDAFLCSCDKGRE